MLLGEGVGEGAGDKTNAMSSYLIFMYVSHQLLYLLYIIFSYLYVHINLKTIDL